MSAPIRFLQWVLGIAFMIGLADGFGHLTFQMAKAAMHAQQHDQVSWGKFSRSLWINHLVHLRGLEPLRHLFRNILIY